MPKKEKPAGKGHNRVGVIAVEELESIVTRVESIEAEKAVLVSDIRECIKQRRMDAQEREERETILDTYRVALGLIPEVDDVV